MARGRSRAYKAICDRQAEQLADRTWKPGGPRWRNRVGLIRMTAAECAAQADTLLNDINLSTHRDDPALELLLENARVAARAYYVEIVRDNWDRLQRTGRHSRD